MKHADIYNLEEGNLENAFTSVCPLAVLVDRMYEFKFSRLFAMIGISYPETARRDLLFFG